MTTCTVTVDMTGLLAKLDTMNGHLSDINTSLVAIATGTAIGAAANLFTGSSSWLATLAGTVVSNVLQANIAGDTSGIHTDLQAIANAMVAPGFTLPLADRIAPDTSPSLSQRLVSYDATDPVFEDVGPLADRLSPLPTDAQRDAVDDAWSTDPSTDNIADQVAGLVFNAADYDF